MLCKDCKHYTQRYCVLKSLNLWGTEGACDEFQEGTFQGTYKHNPLTGTHDIGLHKRGVTNES
jgi:hypothetical protein